MTPTNFQQLSNFIWSAADLLRGPYRPPQYERAMLPMTALRRFDCVLRATKKPVLAEYRRLEGKDRVDYGDRLLDRLAVELAKVKNCNRRQLSSYMVI